MKIYSPAPAKVNIHLSILGRRKDGFHNLSSLFQAVSLFDELFVETVSGGGCTVVCREAELPEENTLTCAYREFSRVTGFDGGIRVVLKKNIPAGAGLGGGSSDGAALLRILNHVSGGMLSGPELEALAGCVGSDVPFFVRGGVGVVSGRGEIIEPLFMSGGERPLFFVRIWPEVFSSTPEAYRLFDSELDPEVKEYGRQDFEKYYSLDPVRWPFFNSFEPLISDRFPAVKAALEALRASGAGFVSMSGSGSSVFGVFTEEASCRNAFKTLAENWRFCYAIKSLSGNPPVEILK